MRTFIQEGKNLPLVVTHPAVPVSGEPVRFGSLTGVAIADEGAGGVLAAETMVALDYGVYDLSVGAIDQSGNSAVVVGDSIYFTDATTPHLNKDARGFFFGYALTPNAAVDGSAATIHVLHLPPPGQGTTPADNTVSTTKMTVGAAKANLTATPATSGELDPTTIQYAIIAVTNAQIKALAAAAKELVAAPGVGKVLEFISATLLLDYGSNVLTRPNADEDFVVRYENGTGPVASEVSAAGFPVAAADQVCVLGKAATATMTKAATENKALVLDNDGTGEFGGNAGADTLLRVKVAYRVHVTGF